MTNPLSHLSGLATHLLAWVGISAILIVLMLYILIEIGVISWRVWNREKFWSALMKFGDNREYKPPIVDISIDPTGSANTENGGKQPMQVSPAVRAEQEKILNVLNSQLEAEKANGASPTVSMAFAVVTATIERASPNRFATDKPQEIREILVSMVKQYKNANGNAGHRDAADALQRAIDRTHVL